MNNYPTPDRRHARESHIAKATIKYPTQDALAEYGHINDMFVLARTSVLFDLKPAVKQFGWSFAAVTFATMLSGKKVSYVPAAYFFARGTHTIAHQGMRFGRAYGKKYRHLRALRHRQAIVIE